MKYFKWELWASQSFDTGEEWDKNLEEYKLYLEQIESQIPSSFVTLIYEFTLHDSQLVKLNIDLENKIVEMFLNGYDIDNTKCCYYLKFSKVKTFKTTGSPESLGGPGGYGHLGYEEIELLEKDLFEIRFLFSTGIEMVIQCGDFLFEMGKKDWLPFDK